MKLNTPLSTRATTTLSILVIILVALVPLFFNLPFRDNIYLSWEGAYRMYKGQMPFKDFGIPLGYAYWLLPALSFHVFGPYLFSLVKIQVLINVISGLSFFSIIRKFSNDNGLHLAIVILYALSFSFYNFWPWYNHTVIVYEFIGIAFLLQAIFLKGSLVKSSIYLVSSSLFCFLSFFTKQDGGAFALFVCGLILLYHTFYNKNWKAITVFSLSYIVIAAIFILPLIQYQFGYWFNLGQAPHYSRVNSFDLLSVLLGESHFIKFYFILIVLIVGLRIKQQGVKGLDFKFGVYTILTISILFQASVLQVTSYVPVDGNIYFHSFMVYFILVGFKGEIKFNTPLYLSALVLMICFWWSGRYWDYANRLFSIERSEESTNVVSMSSYTMNKDTTLLDKSNWRVGKYKQFDNIKLPVDNLEAIDKLVEWKANQRNDVRILNMSELTPISDILAITPEKGMPLWYHMNVGMFDKELNRYIQRIENSHYDLVLFENIPHLNNFYPFEVREVLISHYDLLFSFHAPRDFTRETIEVYVKRE